MNELQKLYDVLVREGKYTKSFEEFQNQWNDEAYKDKVYDVVSRDGLYTKDRNSFKQKYSGRVQQDVNEDGSVVEQAFGLVNKIAKTPAAPQKTHELPRMPKPGELQNIGREDENAAFDSQGNYNPINALPESIKVTAKQIHAENEAKKKAALQSDLSSKQKAVESTAQQQEDASLLASQSAREAEVLSPLLKNEFLKGVYQQLKDEETLPSNVKDQLNQITPELISLGEFKDKDPLNPININRWVANIGVEEAVVPKMNYMFGPLGFKFEEAGMTGDYMTVTAPNKETIEISLNNTYSKNEEETKKLKNFIASNSTKIPQIEKYAAQYAGSDMRFNSEKQIEAQTKDISIQYDKLNKDAALLSNDIKNVESDLAYLNSAPANERNTPQYLEKKKATEAALLDINTRRQEIISRNSQIEANKTNLDKAVGKYTAMKAEQGTWTGATYSFIGEGISTSLSGLLNLALDFSSVDMTGDVSQQRQAAINKSVPNNVATGNLEEDAKQGGYVVDAALRLNNYNKSRGKETMPEPKQGQSYKDWYNSLTAEQRNEIRVKIEDDITKRSKELVLPTVREGIQGAITDPNTSVEWKQLAEETFWGGAYAGLVKSAPAMLAPGGWAGRTAAFFSQSNDAVNEEMSRNPAFADVPESEKLLVSIPIGIANAVLEEVGLSNMIKNKGFVNNLVLKAMQKAGVNTTETALSKIIKNDVESMVARGALTLTGAGLAEAETGAGQQIAEYAVKDIYNMAKKKEMFDTPDTLKEYVYDVVRSGAQEAVGGFVMGTPSAAAAAYRKRGFEGMSDEQFKTFEAIANDEKMQSSFVANLKAKTAAGEMTMAEAKEELNDYRNSVGLYRSIPTDLDTESKKKAMNLVREKQVIEESIKDKDEALVKKQKDRIAEINNQLNTLSENAVQKQTTSEVPVQSEAGVGQEVEGGTPTAEPQVTTEEVKEEEVVPAAETQNKKVEEFYNFKGEGYDPKQEVLLTAKLQAKQELEAEAEAEAKKKKTLLNRNPKVTPPTEEQISQRADEIARTIVENSQAPSNTDEVLYSFHDLLDGFGRKGGNTTDHDVLDDRNTWRDGKFFYQVKYNKKGQKYISVISPSTDDGGYEGNPRPSVATVMSFTLPDNVSPEKVGEAAIAKAKEIYNQGQTSNTPVTSKMLIDGVLPVVKAEFINAPTTETKTTEEVTTPVTETVTETVTEAPANKDVFKIDGVEYDQDQAIEKTKEAEIKWGSKMEYSGENEQAKAFADDYNKRTNPYNEDGKLKGQYIQARIAEALNKLPFKKFAELYRKHINPAFSSRNYKLRKGTTFQQEAPYIIGNATFDSNEANEQFLAFAKEAGIEVAPAPAVEATPVAKPAPVVEAPAVEVAPTEEAPKKMTREEIRAKEEEIAEENRKSKENAGQNINVKDYKRTKKRGQDLKVGDVYVRRFGDTLVVYKVLSKLRKYTGQFYNMDVEILHVGNHVNRKEVGPDGEVREDSLRVGNKFTDTFKNMISGSGKFNFGEVTVLENFETAPEAKAEAPVAEAKPTKKAAPTPAPAVEVVAPAPVVEAAPAKTAKEIKALKELDEEIAKLEKYLEFNNRLENAIDEIEMEKSNTKDGIAEIKEKMAKVRETVTNKETRRNLLEELEAELEQFKEDQADIIQGYKDVIAEEKAEMKKDKKRLDKLKAKRDQMTQPEAAPKKPGEMSMAEIEKRFPLAAEFIKTRYNISKVTAQNSLDLLTRSYNELMRYKVGAEKLLLQIEEIENLVEALDQNVKKISKEEFKKQIAESGDFNKKQLNIFNALIDSLQSDTMPEYIRGEQASTLGDRENFYTTSLNQIVSKEPNAFIHEIGHFAFFKILSKEDRLNYYRYMIDSTYGKGKPSLASRLALSADKVVGSNAEGQVVTASYNVADNFSEYFAEQFRQWYMSERLFPKDIDAIFGKVAQFFNLFIEKLKSGKYVDKNLSEYFNKISVKIEKQQKKNEKIQEALGIEETMMNELQDLEDFFGIDPEISPMSMRYDTPLQKMALMYNMTETGFFPRNASEPNINKDFFQFGLKAKRATSGSYYLVNIKTGKMVKPLQRPKGGISPQVSRMSVKTQLPPMIVTIEPIDFENESENIDVYEASNAAEKIAKDNGVNILRGKELIGVALDEEGNIVGGLWTEVSEGEFSFDIAIDKSAQGKGVGEKLVKEAISEFNNQDFDGNLKYKVDVTNPIMERLLSKYGFEVSDRIGGHTIMEHPTNNPKLKTGISPEVSPMKVTPISVKDMSMDDVIETARENGFSDDVIKALLMKRGYAAKDIDSALTFNINFASAYTNNNPRTDSPLPRAFRTLDGGVNAGIKLFFDVRNKLIDFAKSDPKKKKTYAEIRAKAVELLKANPIFQGQEDTKQLELIAAFDKTLNITRGKAISAQIADIRKAIKERLEGVKDLKKAQLILRNFIRQSLPAVKIPRVFFNLEGLTSPAEGINYFNGLRKQIYDFARTDASGVVGKKILVKDAEKIKEFSTKLLKSTELYKKQSPAVQADMENALINSQYTKGPSHTLDIYSQREVNKLIDVVSQTDAKNFLAQAEKVFDIITEQRAKIKNGLLKEMMTLVNKKAKAAITTTGKRRANGLDAQGQSFYQNIKPILKAAITNDTDAMIAFAAELSDTDAIDDALAKEAAGEKLTLKEQALLDKALAFDTFGDILNMELEEVQDLLDGLKGIRSASIVRLNEKRAERAAQREAMRQEADEQIEKDFKALYNPDGSPKDKRQLDNDKAMIWQSFKELKIWSGLKQWLDRYDFVASPISDFFRKTLAHLGTISNILDKTGTFFNDNVYRLLNRMDEVNKTGYSNEMKRLDELANSVKGVTKGYKQIRRLIESVGVVKMVIDGKTELKNGDQLARIYALSLNEVQRAKLRNMGYTDQKIEEIKKILGPEVVQFADKLVGYFSNEYYESVNDVYSFVNDVNLGYVENYFPTQTISPNVGGKLLEDGDFSGIFNAESSPAFKERTDVSSDIDLAPSFTNVVESHFQAMERYKAYAVGVKRLNDLFKIPSVNTLLEETGLKSIMKNLVNMSVNPNAGVKQKQTTLSKAMNKFSGYALAFKLAQIPKQATAIVAAYEDYQFLKNRKVPGLDAVMFAFDMAKALTFARSNFNKFYNISGNFRDRIVKGVEGDVYGLESGGRVFKPLSQKATTLGDVKRFIKSSAASPTMVGDIISVYGYMANYNRDIANGMSPEAALEKFNNYNATLQSRRAADKGTIQFAQNEYVRAFTMFGSTGILQMNKVAMASKNIMRSIGNKQVPSGKDLRALAINLGVANAMFVAASYAFALMKGDDEDKEKVEKKMFEALVGLNLIYQIPLIGGAVEEVYNAIKGEKTMGGDVTNPYSSVFRKIKKYYDDDNTIIENFRPAAELALGMQLDPFIGLYEGATEEFDDEVMYDILGISPSYRPQNASSLEKMSKSELKKYNPDEYERLYGPGSEGYDEEQAKKEAKAAERKARKEAMDDYYNYESEDDNKRGGSRIKSRGGSRASGSRIK